MLVVLDGPKHASINIPCMSHSNNVNTLYTQHRHPLRTLMASLNFVGILFIFIKRPPILGIYYNTSNNWEDGSPFVNACPLGPGKSYVYDIPLINGQTGTHWYHSQLSVQYVDGLRGPLVIYGNGIFHSVEINDSQHF